MIGQKKLLTSAGMYINLTGHCINSQKLSETNLVSTPFDRWAQYILVHIDKLPSLDDILTPHHSRTLPYSYFPTGRVGTGPYNDLPCIPERRDTVPGGTSRLDRS